MTIRKGSAWGTSGPLPDDAVVVRTDAAARAVVEEARRAGRPVPPIGLLGGDLCRTLGGRGVLAHMRTDAATHVTVDVGSVLVDGRQHWFLAHLVVRRASWWGRIFAAMNAQYLGRWDVAPRSHPGDGLLDTFDVRLRTADRIKAARRLPTGTHVPHPDIVERRTSAVQVSFDRAMPVRLDGERVGRVRHLSIRVEADAVHCIV